MEPDNLVLQPRDVRFDWSTAAMPFLDELPVGRVDVRPFTVELRHSGVTLDVPADRAGT